MEEQPRKKKNLEDFRLKYFFMEKSKTKFRKSLIKVLPILDCHEK